MTRYAYARVLAGRNGARQAGAARPVRRLWHVSPEGFRELRRSCLLSRRATAEFLGVAVRTVAYWEAGRCRVPWSVVRLLRIVRLGDLGALSPRWAGWHLTGGALHSPEGRAFSPYESNWWALLVAQAQAFRAGRVRLGGAGAAAPARPQAVPLQPAAGEDARPAADGAGHGQGVFPLNALEGVPVPIEDRGAAGSQWEPGARAQPAPGAGLVPFNTSGTETSGTQHLCGLQPVLPSAIMGPQWPYSETPTHAPNRQVEPAPAPGPQGPSRSGRGVQRPEPQCPVRDGPAVLCALSGLEGPEGLRCGGGWPSGPGSSGSGAVRSSSGGGAGRGTECPLPLRQRQEVQALPWGAGALIEGEKGAAPGELAGSPGAAIADATGGLAPMEVLP